MTVRYKKEPYRFDYKNGNQHHFGRCYISDFKKSILILNKLKEYSNLRINDLPIVFATSRGENWREHFIELWRTGLNIGIERMGSSSFCFSYLGSSDDILDDNLLKNKIIEKRKSYPYTLFFLDVISRSNGVTEDDIVTKFFTKKKNNSFSKGCKDQIHPTMNDLTKWGYVVESSKKRIITPAGEKILNEYNDKLLFVCYKMDLNEDNYQIRLMWSILRTIQGLKTNELPIYPYFIKYKPVDISINEIFNKFNGKGRGKLDKLDKKEKLLKLLNNLGVEYKQSGNKITIFDNIFFSITPSAYVSAGLSEMDEIKKFKIVHKADSLQKNSDTGINNIWVINNHGYEDISLYPDNSEIMSFEKWLKNKESLANKCPRAIILSPDWIPAVLEASCGYLLSYVKNGGCLVIHGPQSGRIGSNRQFYNWLPEDFERLNFTQTNHNWIFDTNRLTNLKIKPIFCDNFDLKEVDVPIKNFSAKYGNGYFVFLGEHPSKESYNETLNKYVKKTINDFSNTPEWKFREIAQLNRNEKILKEEHIYPIIGKILQDYIGLTLSETFCCSWKGIGKIEGGVDLFTTFPAITLWEVDSIKGKSGFTGGIAGDSTAIDQTHATKCDSYRRQTDKQYKIMLEIIDSINYDNEEMFLKKAIEEIKKHEKKDNHQIEEILTTYLDFYKKSNIKFNKNNFLNFIVNNNSLINNEPVISLIGASYGFYEGEKLSAREISSEYNYSLWTYRDFYEFLVRSYKYTKNERRDILLKVLNKRSGPVYTVLMDFLK